MSAARNLNPWRPGQSGNISGRPKLPDELRGIKALTSLEANKLISKYARMTKAELVTANESPTTPVLELTIISIFMKAIENGDFTRLSFLLDRSIGKVPVVQETDAEEEARREIEELSDSELIRLVIEKIPEITQVKKAE